MALDKRLKSDMTGFPVEEEVVKEAEEPVSFSVEPEETNPIEEAFQEVSFRTDNSKEEIFTEADSREKQMEGTDDFSINCNKNPSTSEEENNKTAKAETFYEAEFAKLNTKLDAMQEEMERVSKTSAAKEDSSIKEDSTQELLKQILEKIDRNDRQLTQNLRENATFRIQVRQGMQQDLDEMKKKVNGEQFNPILKEIASIYVEYQNILEDETLSSRTHKNLLAMFEQMADLMGDYGAEIVQSEEGEVRSTKFSKVIDKIPTGESDKHNTVAVSRRPGVVRDKNVLYPEFVDVYVYDERLEAVHEEKEVKEEANAMKEGAEEQTEELNPVEAAAESQTVE